MGGELTKVGEDLDDYGPAMQGLTQLQRNFVNAYLEHPNYSAGQIAQEAGYSGSSSVALRVAGHMQMHNEKVIAAINEEASKRLRSAGLIGVTGIIKIAMNEAHRDHLKACAMLADRTGFHALSEHKVTVDDKRPQTKQELIEAVRRVANEVGLDEKAIKLLTGENVIEAEFTEVEDVVTMEGL